MGSRWGIDTNNDMTCGLRPEGAVSVDLQSVPGPAGASPASDRLAAKRQARPLWGPFLRRDGQSAPRRVA